ncbi:MAG: hypothetical protein EBR10_03175 [Planctomycetes bacterium]|nr:hypothetical protein [Planctomycetota bacterium]
MCVRSESIVRTARLAAPRAFALMEVIVAGVILAIGLGAAISLSMQSLTAQQRGEHAVQAAALMDELLGSLVALGPVEWNRQYSPSGSFSSFDPNYKYGDFQYDMKIEDAPQGMPCDVLLIVKDPQGREYRCATRVALRLGEDPDPERSPSEALDRAAYFESLEEDPSAAK